MTVLFEKTSILDGLSEVANAIGKILMADDGFTLLLTAEMGSGKTTFVRYMLNSLGLSEDTPVVSPTYTLMNEYKVGDQWFAHLDLYRFTAGACLEELGVLDTRDFRGIFVEWPDQSGQTDELHPTHQLTIEMDGLERRSYRLESF